MRYTEAMRGLYDGQHWWWGGECIICCAGDTLGMLNKERGERRGGGRSNRGVDK